MPANTNPIYTINPINTWGKVTAADAGTNGTGANVVLVYTAGADAGFLQRLIIQPISTSGSTTTSPAAIRFYMNNGSAVGVAANNILFQELSLPATGVNISATAGTIGYQVPFLFQLQSGYAIYCGITAMAANTQWNIMAVCGNY